MPSGKWLLTLFSAISSALAKALGRQEHHSEALKIAIQGKVV
jgi:hypothetical protein